MDVLEATAAYEKWLGQFCEPHAADLEFKRTRMADPHDPFPFFRGTYYRWAELWPTTCPVESTEPRVLAVGDLHPENFGTWRDADGRLCWGVNDFDEADELPYSNDLIRLAAGVRIARLGGHLDVKLGRACRAILAGYREALEAGGIPFVLEERHPELRALAMAAERAPARFWTKLTAVLADPPVQLPSGAKAAVTRDLPAKKLAVEYRHRPRIGMGSLGKPRFVALTEWDGGWIAREVKAVTPPATAWLTKKNGPMRAAEAASRAIRCQDPFYRPGSKWITRRLAPRCSRIEIGLLKSFDDVLRVLWAMGVETANVHLGTPGTAESILRDLSGRPRKWLVKAARASAQAMLQDWQAWQAAVAKGGVNHQGQSISL